MAKMDDIELKGLLQAAYSDALSSNTANKLSQDREKAMRYYLGDVSQDIPNEEGRSEAVSFDVSDTVEGLMPVIMEIFTGTDEVVKFEAQGPEDAKAAEQETDYINHVFMQQNPGFITLYSMSKDALLSKCGLAKVWWQVDESEEEETYYSLSDDQYMMIAANPDVEIIEHTERDTPEPVDGKDYASV